MIVKVRMSTVTKFVIRTWLVSSSLWSYIQCRLIFFCSVLLLLLCNVYKSLTFPTTMRFGLCVLLLVCDLTYLSVGFTPPVTRLKSDICQRRNTLSLLQYDQNERDVSLLAKPRVCSNNSRCCNTSHTHLALTEHNITLQLMRLEKKTNVLESALSEICSAVMFCDDVALMEHQALGIGDIYIDSGFASTRRPRMLREEVKAVVRTHAIHVKPLMHKWHYSKTW